jgi:hypothetical protein
VRPGGRHRRRGQAIVEFALIFPVFLLLTVGIVDAARIFSAYSSLIDGVREAALYAGESPGHNLNWCWTSGAVPCRVGVDASHTLSPDPDNIAFHVAVPGIEAAQVVMADPVCVPDPCVALGKVAITASYRVPLLTPILSSLFGGDILISATTTAMVLQ